MFHTCKQNKKNLNAMYFSSLMCVVLFISFFTQCNSVKNDELNSYYKENLKYECVLVDTISFATSPIVVQYGRIGYLFENYPENDYSFSTFKKMLKKSEWYFFMPSNFYDLMMPYKKSGLHEMQLEYLFQWFLEENVSENLRLVYNGKDLMFYELPDDKVYVLTLEKYKAYCKAVTIHIDYVDAPTSHQRKLDEMPPYKFCNPINTYVKVLRLLNDDFRNPIKRTEAYDLLNKITKKGKIYQLY